MVSHPLLCHVTGRRGLVLTSGHTYIFQLPSHNHNNMSSVQIQILKTPPLHTNLHHNHFMRSLYLSLMHQVWYDLTAHRSLWHPRPASDMSSPPHPASATYLTKPLLYINCNLTGSPSTCDMYWSSQHPAVNKSNNSIGAMILTLCPGWDTPRWWRPPHSQSSRRSSAEPGQLYLHSYT